MKIKAILTIIVLLMVATTACATPLSWNPPVDCSDIYYVVSGINGTSETPQSNEIMIPNNCNVTGYKVCWGTVQGEHPNCKDVGNVLTIDTDEVLKGIELGVE